MISPLTENIFVQTCRNAKLIGSDNLKETSVLNGHTVSNKYGLYLTLLPENRIYSTLNKSLTNGLQAQNENLRIVDYYDSECEIVNVEVSHDGEIFAAAINRTSGAFVELFDVQCFDPKSTQSVFPLAVIRISKNSDAKIMAFSFNPCQNVFAVSTSDGTLNTIQYELVNGSSFTIIGTQQMNSLITCISWSPKGKQLTVGDSTGKLHQLKPELAPVRVIEAPKQLPGLNAASCRCVDVCWLSTTEWLVVYSALQSYRNELLAISLLTVKKQMPPNWASINCNIDWTANSNKMSKLKIYPLLDWQLVFICTSRLPTCVIIGCRNNEWTLFNVPVFWPEELQNIPIVPIGGDFDVSDITPIFLVSQQLPPQPIFNVLTADMALVSFNIISLIERPPILRAPQHVNAAQAKFGNPPANYKPRVAHKLPSAASLQSIQQNIDPAGKPTLPSEQLAKNAVTLQKENRSVGQSSETMSGALLENSGQSENVLLTAQAPKLTETPEETERKAVAALEHEFCAYMNVYCGMRNEWSENIGQLREINGTLNDFTPAVTTMAEQVSSKLNKCKHDIQSNFDHILCQLEQYNMNVLDSVQLLEQMKYINQYGSNDTISQRVAHDMMNKFKEFDQKVSDVDCKFSNLRILIEKSEKAAPAKPLESISVNDVVRCENFQKKTKKVADRCRNVHLELEGLSYTLTRLKNQMGYRGFDSTFNFCQHRVKKETGPLLQQAISPPTPASLNNTRTEMQRYLQLGTKLEERAQELAARSDNFTKILNSPSNANSTDIKNELKHAATSSIRSNLVSVGTQSPRIINKANTKTAENAEHTQKSKPVLKSDTPIRPFSSNFNSTPIIKNESKLEPAMKSSLFSENAQLTSQVPVQDAKERASTSVTPKSEAFTRLFSSAENSSEPISVQNEAKSIVSATTTSASTVTQTPSFNATITKATTLTSSITSDTVAPSVSHDSVATLTPNTSQSIASPIKSAVGLPKPATTPASEPSQISFLFKPPTPKTADENAGASTPQAPPAAPLSTSTFGLVSAEDGMDQDMNGASAPVAASEINFNFNSFGLGAAKPAESSQLKTSFGLFSNAAPQKSSLFGGGVNNAAGSDGFRTLGSGSTNGGGTTGSSIFGGGTPSNSSVFGGGTTAGGSAFGSGVTTNSNIFGDCNSGNNSAFGDGTVSGGTTFGGSAFGNSSFGGGAVQTNANAGSLPLFGETNISSNFNTASSGQMGSTVFGGGATFCGASPFQNNASNSVTSLFASKTFSSASSGSVPQKTFGMFANNSPTTPKSSLFGGGTNTSGSAFGSSAFGNIPQTGSAFGGGAAAPGPVMSPGQGNSSIFGDGAYFGSSSPFQQGTNTNSTLLNSKSAAFTMMRK